MDMSDIDHESQPGTPALAHRSPAPEPRWRELVGEISAEIAGPLTAALERIHALTSSGRIERSSLRALRAEVEQARQVGMAGQQLVRIASGRLRQSHERVELADTLQRVLAQRARATQSRGIVLKPTLRPAEVIVDASLLFGLLNTLVEWALANAQSQIELSLEVDGWPARTRLRCRFVRRTADAHAAGGNTLDSLNWRLLEQTAGAMKLPIERDDAATSSTVLIEFARTVGSSLEGVTATELDDGLAPSPNSKPLAGNHVLVVVADRDTRACVRTAIADMGLIIDQVSSIQEAEDFCRDGLPHAIVVASALCDARFAALRADIRGEVPDFVFIELLERGDTFEISSGNGTDIARVGGDAIASALPSALMFELSRLM
jgi:hypothetical protein